MIGNLYKYSGDPRVSFKELLSFGQEFEHTVSEYLKKESVATPEDLELEIDRVGSKEVQVPETPENLEIVLLEGILLLFFFFIFFFIWAFFE